MSKVLPLDFGQYCDVLIRAFDIDDTRINLSASENENVSVILKNHIPKSGTAIILGDASNASFNSSQRERAQVRPT